MMLLEINMDQNPHSPFCESWCYFVKKKLLHGSAPWIS